MNHEFNFQECSNLAWYNHYQFGDGIVARLKHRCQIYRLFGGNRPNIHYFVDGQVYSFHNYLFDYRMKKAISARKKAYKAKMLNAIDDLDTIFDGDLPF